MWGGGGLEGGCRGFFLRQRSIYVFMRSLPFSIFFLFNFPILSVEDFLPPPSFQPLKKAIVTIYFLNHKQISWSFTTVLLIRIESQKVKKLQNWRVARATMTLSSVSPAWPLKMTPWNSWQICYHSSTANKEFFTEKTYSKNPLQLTNWNIFMKL